MEPALNPNTTTKTPGFLTHRPRTLLGLRLLAVSFTAVVHGMMYGSQHLWPLHWVLWLPFLWAILAQDGKGRVWLGFFAGTLTHAVIFPWYITSIPRYVGLTTTPSVMVSLLLYMYLALPWLLLAWLLPKLIQHFPRVWPIGLACWTVALEYITPQLFPYTQGVSHYQVTSIFMVVSLVGTYGMTFLLMWANGHLFQGLQALAHKNPWPWKHSLLFLSVLAGCLLYGGHRQSLYKQHSRKARTLKVGIIQGNVSIEERRKVRHRGVHQIYMGLSDDAKDAGVDWIVWPEDSFRLGLLSAYVPRELLLFEVKQLGRPVLLGGRAFSRDGKSLHNSAIHADPKTGFGQRYDKTILVPFSEYIPFQKYMTKVIGFKPNKTIFVPGKKSFVRTLQGVKYSFLICYEAIFSGLARTQVRQGSRLFVNLTNDAGFGRTSEPYQHLIMATVRSAELGIPMIRATTSGFSVNVNALGQIKKRSQWFKRQLLIVSVPLIDLPSLYRIIGGSFAWLCTALSFLSLGLMLRKAE